MIEKIELDMLNDSSVSVKSQRYYEGEPLGKPHRKAYTNSERGRQELVSELPQEQQNAIFAIWGDTPTVDETVE